SAFLSASSPPVAVTTRKPSSVRAIETSFVIRGSSSATRTSGCVPTPHLLITGTDGDPSKRVAPRARSAPGACSQRLRGGRACRGGRLARRRRVDRVVVVVRRGRRPGARTQGEVPNCDQQHDDADDPQDHAHVRTAGAVGDDNRVVIVFVRHGGPL